MQSVDNEKHLAGSVWPVAASKAKATVVSVKHTMAKAGWLREATFAKDYNKILTVLGPFQYAVLQQSVSSYRAGNVLFLVASYITL